MLGRQKQRSRTSSVPPVCTPLPQHMSHYMCRLHICVPFSAGNLSRKGDLILCLISQSECNSAWFIINSHLWNPHFNQTQPEEGEGLSKPLPLQFSPPSLWTQPERREEEHFHHTSPSFFISESLTSKMETPKCVIQLKNPYALKQMLFIEHLLCVTFF